MTEAKVPDENSDWKSIDIFLFSNGQKTSPPRKYHIESNQLDWWTATLNYLAKAQYGSMHSVIDLYTIEGLKIETPLQLSHDTAYVAVVPPDYFIDAGYENYLMKASRSWEKGQARRKSTTAVSHTDNLILGDDESSWDNKYHDLPIKEIKDDSVKTIVTSRVNHLESDILKPQHVANKPINNKLLRGNAGKQPDRRKISISQSPAAKKIGSSPSPLAARKSSIKRKDSVKINSDTKNELPSTGGNNVASKNKLYRPYKKQDSPPVVELSKVEDVLKELKSSSSCKLVSHNNSLLTKNAEVENFFEYNGMTAESKVYRNPHSEKPSIAVDPHVPLFDNREDAITEQFGAKHHNLEKKDVDIKNEVDTTIQNVPFKLNAFDDLLTGTGVLDHPKTTDHTADKTIDISNKKSTLNLKLNIEIWNEHNDAISDTKPNSKKDLQNIKHEKGSQVDIEEKTVEHDKLHAVICNEKDNKDIDGKQNLILVKCTCQAGDNSTVNTLPINSNFVIVLPLLNLEERFKRCNCKDEQEMNERNISLTNPVKKTVSCTSLLKHEIVSHIEMTSRNNSREVLQDANDFTMIKRKSVAIREGQTIFTESKAEENSKQPVQIVYSKVVDTPELDKLNKKSVTLYKTANNFTQTELCDMLMEARLQKDGHYSFHAPSLKTLKHYKL